MPKFNFKVEINERQLDAIEKMGLEVRVKHHRRILAKVGSWLKKKFELAAPSGDFTGTRDTQSKTRKAQGWKSMEQSIWKKVHEKESAVNVGFPLASVTEYKPGRWQHRMWGRDAVSTRTFPFATDIWETTEEKRAQMIMDDWDKAIKKEAKAAGL